MLQFKISSERATANPLFGLRPCAGGPHPWSRLPAELTQHVLAAWRGADLNDTVRFAAQVHPHWDSLLRWAQPAAYGRLQQYALLFTVIGGAHEPVLPLIRRRLEHYRHVKFDAVSERDGLEAQLFAADTAQLGVLMGLLPEMRSCSLVGLERGPDLLVQWAQQGLRLHELQELTLDRRKLLQKDVAKLLSVASLMPKLERIDVVGKPAFRPCGAQEPLFLGDKAPALSCEGWPLLRHLDVSHSGLNLASMALHHNGALQYLNVAGSAGAADLLLGARAPGASLQTLHLSAAQWTREQFRKVAEAPWLSGLVALHFVGVGAEGGIFGLDLNHGAALQVLTLAGQNVDYNSLRIAGCPLGRLDVSATGMDAYNAPEPGAFSQASLWHLQMGRNHLPGMLNVLDLFATPHLQVLDLSGCGLNDVDIVNWHIPEHNTLTHLDLSANNIDGAALDGLSKKPLKSLRYLGIRVRSKRASRRLVSSLLRLGPLRKIWPQLQTLSVWSHQMRNPVQQERLLGLLEDDNISTELPPGFLLENIQKRA